MRKAPADGATGTRVKWPSADQLPSSTSAAGGFYKTGGGRASPLKPPRSSSGSFGQVYSRGETSDDYLPPSYRRRSSSYSRAEAAGGLRDSITSESSTGTEATRQGGCVCHLCSCIWQIKLEPVQRLWVSLLLMVIVWLVVGVAVFMSTQGWNIYEATYYAVNVGLGVGYGQLVVHGAGSKWFTIAYCITGASLIAGAGALAVQAVLLRQGDMDIDASWKRLHPERYERGKPKGVAWVVRRLLGKYRFRVLSVVIWLGWVGVGVAFAMDGHLNCPHSQQGYKLTEADCKTFTEGVFFVITSMSTAAQVHTPRCLPPLDMPNMTSSDCKFGHNASRPGVTVACLAPCKTNDFGLGFTAMYIFFGIPLFASLMGFIADIYISKFQRRQARMNASVATAEMNDRTFAEMAHLNIDMMPRAEIVEALEGGTELGSVITRRTVPWYYVVTAEKEKAILWGEFLEYQLNALGAVDQKLLAGIKRDFRNLDMGAKGYLAMSDVATRTAAARAASRWKRATKAGSANRERLLGPKEMEREMGYPSPRGVDF